MPPNIDFCAAGIKNRRYFSTVIIIIVSGGSSNIYIYIYIYIYEQRVSVRKKKIREDITVLATSYIILLVH